MLKLVEEKLLNSEFSRGLLSAHILAYYLQERDGILLWYNGELLELAKDLGYRLLPAFNTTTGIPYSRVCFNNAKYINVFM